MLLNAYKEFGLAINIRNIKNMDEGHHQSMMANEYVKVGSNSYKKMKTFTYLDSLLTNQNSIHEEIKFRFTAGNSCY